MMAVVSSDEALAQFRQFDPSFSGCHWAMRWIQARGRRPPVVRFCRAPVPQHRPGTSAGLRGCAMTNPRTPRAERQVTRLRPLGVAGPVDRGLRRRGPPGARRRAGAAPGAGPAPCRSCRPAGTRRCCPRPRPRPPRGPGAAAERGLGGGERVHERDRRGAGLAGPGGVGDAPGRLRAGQRHADRRRPPGRSPATRPLAGAAREFSFLAVAGGLALWLLRLTMAPGRRWPGSAPG